MPDDDNAFAVKPDIVTLAQADEQPSEPEASEAPPSDKPEVERSVEVAPSAPERLRAYEDELFGADAMRFHDKVERGSGSPFSRMTAEQLSRYQALEHLVVTEQKLADASAALLQAEVAHAEAEIAANA